MGEKAMILKERGEWHMGKFGERKRKGEIATSAFMGYFSIKYFL